MENSIFTKPIISIYDTQRFDDKVTKSVLVMSSDGTHSALGTIIEDTSKMELKSYLNVFKKDNGEWKEIWRNDLNTIHSKLNLLLSQKSDFLALSGSCSLALLDLNVEGEIYNKVYSEFLLAGSKRICYLGMEKEPALFYIDVRATYSNYATSNGYESLSDCIKLKIVSFPEKEEKNIFLSLNVVGSELIDYKLSVSDDGEVIFVSGVYTKHERKHYFERIFTLDEDNNPELIANMVRDYQIENCDILSIGCSTISSDGDKVAVSYLLKKEGKEQNVLFVYDKVLNNKPNTKFMGKSKCHIIDIPFNPTSISFNQTADKIVLGNNYSKECDCDKKDYPLNRPFIVLGLLSDSLSYGDVGMFGLGGSTRQLFKWVLNNS